MSARITIAPANEQAVRSIAHSCQLPWFIARTLVARGFDEPDKAQAFLSPSLERDWRDPYEINDLDRVVDGLQAALQESKHVLVFGDFDLDGISATAIMARGLQALGGTVTPFIPLRFEEGYGLTEAAIERVLTHGPDVVVTVDNGISAKHEVATLQDHGITVLVTDHHEPADLVPEGVPVADPKKQDIPSQILAGAGVALKTVQALGARFGKPNLWLDLLDFATLGTVADLMPMVGENRALVSEGIRMMNEQPRPCLAALMAQAGLADKPLTSTNLSFTLVPRLNAAGRMGNAQLALDLLMSDDYAQACALAAQLEETNTRRRTIESELADVAFAQSEQKFQGQRALVVSGEDWHEGVKGIVASRLCNRYGVPSILFTIADGEARGSGRSVGDVNLFKAVESCSDLLTRFGGHEAAVGVTLPVERLAEFEERLCRHMDALDKESFQPSVRVDAPIDLSEMTVENVGKLELLAPFGQENPQPTYLAQDVMLDQARAVGADKTHLSCKLINGVHQLACIMFRAPDIQELVDCKTLVSAVFQLQIDTWRGNQTVKAVVSQLLPAAPCGPDEQVISEQDAAFVDGLLADACQADGAAAGNCPGVAEAEAGAGKQGGSACDACGRSVWEELAQGGPELLRQALVSAFLGDGSLHPAQAQALQALDDDASTLCVMGTGRGKSLIFQVHAAETALAGAGPTLVLYPLRALIHDQAYHMQRALDRFGLHVEVLCGDTPRESRFRIMSDLAAGRVDVLLSTPEYAIAHAGELSAAARFAFLVVDEAHHVATSTQAFRPLYRELAGLRHQLQDPVTLAVSATVTTEAAQAIGEDLGITRTIRDDAERANLHVVDERGCKRKDAYLATLAAQGRKMVVYVNSRMETIALTRALRMQVPQVAPRIGFYNAGLSRSERARVEELFRSGALQVLIATSAFGEGIDIPEIRDVVLYHMPFSQVEFNQMSGRAGRDGHDAWIHLLYSRKDAGVNESILLDQTPARDTMAQVYRTLRRLQAETPGSAFEATLEEVAQQAQGASPFPVSASNVTCALATFGQLGLVECEPSASQPGAQRIHVVDYQGKVELSQSVRYQEGQDEQEAFAAFCSWSLDSSAAALQDCIRHPLMPR